MMSFASFYTIFNRMMSVIYRSNYIVTHNRSGTVYSIGGLCWTHRWHCYATYFPSVTVRLNLMNELTDGIGIIGKHPRLLPESDSDLEISEPCSSGAADGAFVPCTLLGHVSRWRIYRYRRRRWNTPLLECLQQNSISKGISIKKKLNNWGLLEFFGFISMTHFAK